MSLATADLTRTPFSSLSTHELLDQSVEALLGVSPAAATELADLGILTVFDLASSSTFATAHGLVAAATLAATNGAGDVPGDLIDSTARDIGLARLPLEPISILRSLGPTRAQSLSAALGVTNVRELALWPPYHAARTALSASLGLEPAIADLESPPDLVPGSRRYPTERVQYEVLILDEVEADADLKPLKAPRTGKRPPPASGTPLEGAGQLDLAASATEAMGFTRPAVGAVLTYNQSWYSEGLALGQLLHTVALAPGESTRIAMIDWTRRSSAATREGISETEALSSSLERGRSISEIVNAVATEAQQGFSSSFGVGAGTSTGHASGGAGSADLSSVTGLPVKVAGGAGDSAGLGVGIGYAQSSGWSTGMRNLSANMAQNVLDRTHQASNSARNRWATIVREVSQTESERVSTRTVTNYNHMHALSIEYFEIVQLYRVAVELARVSACLFIPMKLIDFNRPGVVARYKRVLAEVGLTPQMRALAFAEPDTLLLTSPGKTGNWRAGDVQMTQAMFGEPVGAPDANALALPLNFFPMFLSWFEDAPFETFVFEFSNGSSLELPVVTTVNAQIGKFNVILSEVFGQTIDRASSFWDVVSIRGRKKADSVDWAGRVNVYLRMASLQREGFPKPSSGLTAAFLRVAIDVDEDDGEVVVFEASRTVGGRELRQHLMENQLYYSQQVWRTVDTTTVAQMLSRYTFGGRPVLSQVDPQPITVAGNFLVFRRHEPLDAAGQAAWATWLQGRDIKIGDRKDDLVPLPSGGVFAEAVLGRFNSAEKLDITRFWNWQDSPIPITPTEIAAIGTGSRARVDDLIPGQLREPVLNIQLPPDLPDPEGLAAILEAIQNGAMFRDMSGMGATIGFAQAALSRAFDAAKDAAAQAGENMKTAADIYKSAFGGGGAPGGTPPGQARGTTTENRIPSTPSNAGAMINQGRALDQRRPGAGAAAGSNGAGPGVAPGGGVGVMQGSNEQRAFESMLSGSGGTASTSQASTAGIGSLFGAGSKPATIGRRSTKADALSKIAQYRASTATQPWKIDRTLFYDRLEQLVNDPGLVDQDGLNLCGPAAFLRIWIARDPLAFVEFSGRLFDAGKSSIGPYTVEPGSDSLIAEDYDAIRTAYTTAYPNRTFTPVGEWVVMGSIRDAENAWFDFEGKPVEDVSAGTYPGEMVEWLEATNLYGTVKDEGNFFLTKGLAHAKGLAPGPTRDVVLLINAHMLTQMNVTIGTKKSDEFILSAFPNHFVVLTSDIQETPDGRVSLSYWTWGQHYSGTIDRATFEANYYGAVIGEGAHP